MSQAKVDQYKKEKYARKHTQKKTNIKRIIGYVVASIIALAFAVYIGYSIGLSTGLIDKKTTMSSAELESLRNVLIQNNDPNVQNNGETTAATETTTVAE